MFERVKSLFGWGVKPSKPSVDLFENDNKATYGIELGCRVSVKYPVLSLYDELEFELGESLKKVTGVSLSSDSGSNSFRAYTEDDYFIQFDYFGNDLVENLSQITMMKYQLDDGDEFLTYTPEELELISPSDFENGVSAHLKKAEKWKKIIDFDQSFEFRGHVYHRFNELTMGGIEVVELDDSTVNALENNFSVFVREINEALNEVLFVNAEQELVVGDDNQILERSNSITVSIALGVTIAHSSILVNHNKGN